MPDINDINYNDVRDRKYLINIPAVLQGLYKLLLEKGQS